MRLIISTIFILFSLFLHAQGGWVKFLDSGPLARNEVYDISLDNDGFIYVLGNNLNSNKNDLYLFKVDTFSNIIVKSIKEDLFEYSVAIRPANNIYINDQTNQLNIYADLLFSENRQFLIELDLDLDTIGYNIYKEDEDILANFAN